MNDINGVISPELKVVSIESDVNVNTTVNPELHVTAVVNSELQINATIVPELKITAVVGTGIEGKEGKKGDKGDTYVLNILGGTRAITYDLNGNNPSPSMTPLSCELLENGIPIVPESYSWSTPNAGSVLNGLSTGPTFTPLIDLVYDPKKGDNHVDLEVVYKGISVKETVLFNVNKDGGGYIAPYEVTLVSSRGERFKSGTNFATDITAFIYQAGLDITDTIDASRFVWKRTSDNPVEDEQWNQSHYGYKKISITQNDVDSGSTVFECDITEY